MPIYTVAVPITGIAYVEVKADSEDDAINEALNSEDLTIDKIEEWDAHRAVCKGNVLYAMQNEAEVVSERDE